jgi:hypothetical protein
MTAVTSTDAVTRCVEGLLRFLETSGVEFPDGLFHDDVFFDFTSPTWRLQARGVDGIMHIRQEGHPWPGRVPRSRVDRTTTGFVLEVEETWEADGDTWYCRELMRADVAGDAIAEISVYCTGDWDSARVAEHAAAVALIRP